MSLLLALLSTITALAAPPSTDDLLNGLSPTMKAQILSGMNAEGICELRVLEKEMRISFKPGPPSSDPAHLEANGQCAKDGPPPLVRITNASDLKSRERRTDWLRSYYGICEYKKQLKKGLERAAVKLKANPDYGLMSDDELSQGALCSIASKEWLPSNTPGSRCLMANGNASTALECFYKDECRFECGGGAKNFQMLGAYEVFAGEDGIMNTSERRRFDRHYRKVTTGKFQWPSTDGLDYEKDDFDGIQLPKKTINLSNEAVLGEYALTGYRVVVDTKTNYRQAYIKNTGAFGGNSSELSSNSIVVSTSPAAVKSFTGISVEGNPSSTAVTGQFEKDMKALTTHYLKLSYMGADEGDPEVASNWRSFDQLRVEKNREAILAGTYKLIRHPSVSQTEFNQDLAAYAEIQKILQKPIYRDTKLYIHPHGIVSLAWAVVDKKGFHPEAQFSLWSAETTEDNQFEHFLTSRIEACLGR